MFNGCQAEPVEALEKVIVKKLEQLNNFKNNRSMTKTFMMLGATLSMGFAYGQEYNRVGINTEVPQATLDVRETPLSLLPAGTPQGVSFPNFSSDERTKFTGVSEGTMIYNTDLDCIEQYTLREKISPNLDWYCMCLCGDETAVVEKDDEVLENIEGFRDEVGERLTFNDGSQYVWSYGSQCHSIPYVRLTSPMSTPIHYQAIATGRHIEKRYTKEFVTYAQNGTTVLDRNTLTLVIPAGDFKYGQHAIVDAYVEIAGSGEFITKFGDVFWDIELGGLQTKVILNLPELMIECEE